MALPIAAALGTAATAAYLDAKLHIRNDLGLGVLNPQGKPALQHLEEHVKRKRIHNFDIFEETRNRTPKNIFLIFEGKTWTYAEFFDRIVATANWLLKDLGVQRGEIVPLYGGNSPEYVVFWFALDAISAVPSFINNNLQSQSLLHCVTMCKSRYVLYDAESLPNIKTALDGFKDNNIEIIQYTPEIVASLGDLSPIPDERRDDEDLQGLRCLIYTSGTTGLPKATRLLAMRELLTGFTFSRYLRLTSESRFYTCLPLYHGAAHGLCFTPTINAGAQIVLARKFSHKKFWKDVKDSNANIIQYVGELCRYLINAPPTPHDEDHNVKMAWGNGMRPDVWEPFRQRFGIETINELYAATDSVSGSFNENRGPFGAHAIGVRGIIWRLTRGRTEKRVRIDPDTQEIIRDSNGFAIAVPDGEPGESVYWVDPAAPKWELYLDNQAAGDKRVLTNLFKKGDMWFRSGDLLRMDKEGRVYFVDRLGDTFRWRSENVSTNEVADVTGKWHQIDESNVIGVEVPKNDGRCGCAVLVLKPGVTEKNFDWKGFAAHCLSSLPRYAVPGFIRIAKSMEYTGTFKMPKGKLRKEGIDPEKISGGDVMYWLPAEKNEYVPFRRKDYDALKGGQARI